MRILADKPKATNKIAVWKKYAEKRKEIMHMYLHCST